MRIAFFAPTDPGNIQWNAPLSFGYLKAASERAFPGQHEYRVVTGVHEIREYRPDVLAISAFTQDYGQVETLCRKVRTFSRWPFIIVGGHHITALPETLPIDADVGVLGEGEQTFVDILTTLPLMWGRDPLGLNPLSEVPGLVLRGARRAFYITHPRPNTPVLDDLAPPDRAVGLQPGQDPYLFTSRGCTFRCKFCVTSRFWKDVRYHSATRVVDEIFQIKEQFPHVKNVVIWDDLFAADRIRLRAIVLGIEARGGSPFTFSGAVRADIVDRELCQLLKRMRYKWISFGAESWSDPILKKLKGGVASAEKNWKALELLNEYGFLTGAGHVLGHWDETERDVILTYEAILRGYRHGYLRRHEINILTPIAGTPVWDYAIEHGHLKVGEWERVRYPSMRINALGSVEDWINARTRKNSVYLNQHNVPLAELYTIIKRYEARIRRGDFGAGTPTRIKAKHLFRQLKWRIKERFSKRWTK